jgi:hypothetical protein
MVSTKYLLDHIDGLLRLSHDAKDRAISAKIREMADELRIMISVADVTDWAATLSSASASSVAVPVSNEIVTALYGTKRKRRRRAKESASDASSPKRKSRAKKRVDK